MTHLRMRAYKPEDYLSMELMDAEKKNREGQPIELWAKTHALAGMAATYTNNKNEIVFCCGVSDLWPGVGEVWAVFSPSVSRYPYSLQIVKWAIRYLLEDGYIRLQTTVAVGNNIAIRFIEHLGFTSEGLMRRYGPHREDHIRYSLLKED